MSSIPAHKLNVVLAKRKRTCAGPKWTKRAGTSTTESNRTWLSRPVNSENDYLTRRSIRNIRLRSTTYTPRKKIDRATRNSEIFSVSRSLDLDIPPQKTKSNHDHQELHESNQAQPVPTSQSFHKRAPTGSGSLQIFHKYPLKGSPLADNNPEQLGALDQGNLSNGKHMGSSLEVDYTNDVVQIDPTQKGLSSTTMNAHQDLATYDAKNSHLYLRFYDTTTLAESDHFKVWRLQEYTQKLPKIRLRNQIGQQTGSVVEIDRAKFMLFRKKLGMAQGLLDEQPAPKPLNSKAQEESVLEHGNGKDSRPGFTASAKLRMVKTHRAGIHYTISEDLSGDAGERKKFATLIDRRLNSSKRRPQQQHGPDLQHFSKSPCKLCTLYFGARKNDYVDVRQFLVQDR